MNGHSYLRTHNLEAEHMLVDLGEAVTELHGESGRDRARGGVTLVKEGGLSVVLVHLHSGATIQEHTVPGVATVQVLDGHVHVRVGDDPLDAPAGRLLAFKSGSRHSVEAIEDSTLLLTLTE